MGTIRKFEDLEIWQLARVIYNKISPVADRLKSIRSFRFCEQIKSSSGSIMDNIAEGFGRGSRLEFINNLTISRGESTELQSQMYRCLDDGIISKAEFNDIYINIDNLKGKISNLVIYLNSSLIKGLKYRGRS